MTQQLRGEGEPTAPGGESLLSEVTGDRAEKKKALGKPEEGEGK